MGIRLQESNSKGEGGMGGTLPSCLVQSSLDQEVQICVLTGDTLLSQCLFQPRCIMGTNELYAGFDPVMD